MFYFSCCIFVLHEILLACVLFMLYACCKKIKIKKIVLYLSACGTFSGIVEFGGIFFRVWNALWYCGISCYIFPRVERVLVLWDLVLYFSACGTCFGIVGFSVIFFRVWNAL